MNNQIFIRVKAILVHDYSVTEEEVTPGAEIGTELGLDSLDMAEFVMHIEKEFSITIPDEDAIKVKTVADVVNYLDGKTQ